jgi:intracellular septation protein
MNGFGQRIVAIVRSKLFVKILLEFMPLGLFFVATSTYNIYVGSAVLGLATLVSMALVWAIYRRLALMAIITGVTGLVAASATVLLVDPTWVKLKPTIVSLVFAAILAAGLVMDKPLLRPLIGEDLNLTDEGWRVVTRRWTIYFFIVAALNEIVWRGADALYPGSRPDGGSPTADQIWASYKVLGLMPFSVLYAAFMLPLLTRYRAVAGKPLGGGDIFARPGPLARIETGETDPHNTPRLAQSPARTHQG